MLKRETITFFSGHGNRSVPDGAETMWHYAPHGTFEEQSLACGEHRWTGDTIDLPSGAVMVEDDAASNRRWFSVDQTKWLPAASEQKLILVNGHWQWIANGMQIIDSDVDDLIGGIKKIYLFDGCGSVSHSVIE